MDMTSLDETTRILSEFARMKFSAQVLDVQGLIQEGATYRWRMVSNRQFLRVLRAADQDAGFCSIRQLRRLEPAPRRSAATYARSLA